MLQNEAESFLAAPNQVRVEQTVVNFVLWLRLAVETLGAVTIGVGIIVAIYVYVRSYKADKTHDFVCIRLTFARFLVLALEFQVAADILSTAVAPSWDQIGKLTAIATIRTALNYFLTCEINAERKNVIEN